MHNAIIVLKEIVPVFPIASIVVVGLTIYGVMEMFVETEYHEMLFRLETEHSNKELYWIIEQSRPVQMISY